MSAVADLTLDALGAHGALQLSGYASCLRSACAASPPPFGMEWYGERYRQVASDPGWLALSLVQNAQVEGDGARKLWGLAGRAADLEIAELVRRHAIDESGHALVYLRMLDLAFPQAVDATLQPLVHGISPRLTMKDRPPALPPSPTEWVLDELIQMNIGEIRTRIHQLLLRPMIVAHAPIEQRRKLERLLDSLLVDETRHIAYTARLIETALVESREYVDVVMKQRVRDFNDITLREVGAEQFSGE